MNPNSCYVENGKGHAINLIMGSQCFMNGFVEWALRPVFDRKEGETFP